MPRIKHITGRHSDRPAVGCAAAARPPRPSRHMCRRPSESGFALLAVLMLSVLLMGMGAAMSSAVLSDLQQQAAHARSTAGFYAAEAGLNAGMSEFKNIFMAYNFPTDYSTRTTSLGDRTITYEMQAVPAPAGMPLNADGSFNTTLPAGQTYAGLNAVMYRYTAQATSELTAGDVEVRLGNEFDVEYIPLFQFLAFYEGTLEILPGPDMNLHGPIHTNGDLYLNANSNLTITDCQPPTCPRAIPFVHVTAAGDIHRGRLDTTSCDGNVQIGSLSGTTPLTLQTLPCSGGTSSLRSKAEIDTWNGAMKAEQPRLGIPPPGLLRYGNGEYWDKADLRLVLELDHPDNAGRFAITVEDGRGDVDIARTAALQNFMRAKPGRIFYNDVPVSGADLATACTDGDSYCNRLNYNPSFGGSDVYPCAGSDLNTPPLAGCATGYITNDALANGSRLAAGDVTARRAGFYNNREQAWVYMLNVNAHDLLKWNRDQGGPLFNPDDTSDGGVVMFLSVRGPLSEDSPAGRVRYGVRVFGSSDLDFPAGVADPTGLTVVSDQAAYLEGDYNVGTDVNPKQPAAIMGDTLNILSSAWSGPGVCQNDCQSRQSLPTRQAAGHGDLLGVPRRRRRHQPGPLQRRLRELPAVPRGLERQPLADLPRLVREPGRADAQQRHVVRDRAGAAPRPP